MRISDWSSDVCSSDLVGGAEGDEGGDVEAAHPDDVEAGLVGGEAELPGIVVAESRLGLDADPRQQRAQFLQDAAFGDRQDQGLVGGQGAGAPQASGVEGRGKIGRAAVRERMGRYWMRSGGG